MAPTKKAAPKTSSHADAGTKAVDTLLATFPPAHRAALEALRRVIRAAAPDAEECISYGLPAFRRNGGLVAYGNAKEHCAFYPMSGTLIARYGDALAGFETSKGTIRFTPEHPLPDALVRRIVTDRITENDEKRPPKRTATPAKKPATKKPASKKPATKKPAAKKPAAKKPAAKKPAAKRPAGATKGPKISTKTTAKLRGSAAARSR